MKINGRNIGPEFTPYIIAEMSGNHNQSLDRALQIVDAAAATGAQALKLQTYSADTMTLDSRENEFFISDPNSPWFGQSSYELYSKAHTPLAWHKPIFDRAKSHGLSCFSSPFDETAIDFLENLNVPAYKIASFECIDLPLITYAAKTGKPLIISTGMATLSEIEEAVMAARDAGCKQLILLKCTSTYPSSPENTNVRTIAHMSDIFGCQIGLSDHTMGVGASIAAVSMGATVIEKHFTLKRSDGGVDSSFSLEPAEMTSLVVETERAWRSLGKIFYGPTDDEKLARKRRRSLYIVDDLSKGDVLTSENVRRLRPGHGLMPKYYKLVLGRSVNRDVKRGTPVSWEIIS